MNQTITMEWMPDKRSTDALKGKGYSNKQLNHIKRCFIRRHLNKEVLNASSLYSNMVKASGAGQDLPKPDNSASEALDKKRADDIANRSKDAHDKAVEAHNVDDGMTKEQAKVWIDKQRGLI